MRRGSRALAGVLGAALLLAGACTRGGGEETSSSPRPGHWHGGTLRVAMWWLDQGQEWLGTDPEDAPGLDPDVYYPVGPNGIFRCCLLRTLMSYSGRTAAEGGTVARPDLAALVPEVSADGLTWTFRLKEGLHYAPPFQETEIVAQDIVRALERESEPWTDASFGYSFYYSVIRGYDEFRVGGADSISGLETPDDHTLVVRLEVPAGDLGHRFALAATAPIPPGAADGHLRNYGRFVVASGPYMIEGSEELDFSPPPKQQQPASGYVPPRFDADGNVTLPGSLTLVRNPSWRPDTDPLRAAYADRIEFGFYDYGPKAPSTYRTLAARLESGKLDIDLFTDDPSWYRRHPSERIHQDSMNAAVGIPMNLAAPPFDDVHVRKAASLVIDRLAIVRQLTERGGPFALLEHIAPDGVEGGLLADWRPDWLSDPGGDLEAARGEMRLSRYDHDGDGRCDGPVCRGVFALVQPHGAAVMWSWEPIRDALAGLGIRLDAEVASSFEEFQIRLGDPSAHAALLIGWGTGWGADFPNGSTFFVPLFSGRLPGGSIGLSLMGATPKQLRRWGYPVTEVPSVDDRIDRCLSLVGGPQAECWAELDQYLMNAIVPMVPLADLERAVVVSERVEHYSIDQATTLPAFDRISLKSGSE